MKEITALVTDPLGIHARSAVVAANAARKFNCKVSFLFGERRADMKEVMELMFLDIPTQSEIKIICSGDDENAAIAGIKEILYKQKILDNIS